MHIRLGYLVHGGEADLKIKSGGLGVYSISPLTQKLSQNVWSVWFVFCISVSLVLYLITDY
jgi:hypothetical protein